MSRNDPASASKKTEMLEVLLSWRIRSSVNTESFSREWR